jgi:hypothetical protein
MSDDVLEKDLGVLCNTELRAFGLFDKLRGFAVRLYLGYVQNEQIRDVLHLHGEAGCTS